MDKPRLLDLLEEVEDYRRGNEIKHNLYDVLAIGLLTILCNGDTFVDMECFGNAYKNTLCEFLELPYGTGQTLTKFS